MLLIRKLMRWILQIAAALVIVLALLVGVVRLLLPEASTLTDDIKLAVRDTAGFDIDFRTITVGVSIYGPELRLGQVTLDWADGGRIMAVERLAVSVDLIDSFTQQAFVPERIRLFGSEVNARITTDGELFLQGRPWRDLLPLERPEQQTELPDFGLELGGIRFTFINEQLAGPLIRGQLNSFEAELDDGIIEVTADAEPGEELGAALGLTAAVPLELLTDPENLPVGQDWSLLLEVEDFRLDPWLRLVDLRELPVIDSEGSATAKLDFEGSELQAISADVDIAGISLVQPDGGPLSVDAVEGRIGWQRSSDGWMATGDALTIARNGESWPVSDYTVSYAAQPAEQRQRILAEVSFVRLGDLLPVLQAVVPEAIEKAGIDAVLEGDVNSLNAELELVDEQLDEFVVAAEFAGLGFRDNQTGLAISGITGGIQANNRVGDLRLATGNAGIVLPDVFRGPLEITKLEGILVWRAGSDGYRVIANSVELETPDGAATASMELTLDKDLKSPVIDASGRASLKDAGAVPAYLPSVLPDDVLGWLDQALVAGSVSQAEFRLRGPLQEFPFDQPREDDTRDFNVTLNFANALLDYAPDWPPVEEARGVLVFDRGGLYTRQNEFTISGIELNDVDIEIVSLREPVLTAQGDAETDLTRVLELLRASPVAEELGPVFADVLAEGPVTGSMAMELPILDMDSWRFDAIYEVDGASAGLVGIDPQFTDIRGSGSLANTFVTLPGATATLLESPVTISVTPDTAPEAVFNHRADVAGTLPALAVWQELGMPLTDLVAGSMPVEAQALFPADPDNEAEPFRILVNSSMTGLVSRWPHPLEKEATSDMPATAEVRFPDDGQIDFAGSMRGIDWNVRFAKGTDGWETERGEIRSGGPRPPLPDQPGIIVSGYFDKLVAQDWYDSFSEEHFPAEGADDEYSGWEQQFASVDIEVDEFHLINHRFIDAGVKARPFVGLEKWEIALAGPWAKGELDVPFSFGINDLLEFDMDRLLLIEPLEGEEDYSDRLDPRDMPSLKGVVRNFALDTMRFGELEMDVQRTADGLRTRTLKTRAPSFRTESSADWVVIDNAQRSRVHIELLSDDFEATLRDLDYAPYITAEKGKVIADLLWEGQPGTAMLYESTGSVRLVVQEGIINDVDAGGGRLLGLVSIAALPRRLSLDFAEITESGLIFDRLEGNFRIDFGDAWTCDLGLEGDIADMGVVGRIGMVSEDYDQIAVVRPHVSNLAPVAGLALGGPAIGAATLLITQIFKKPLSGMGSSYFTISGSWDEPLVEEAEAENINVNQFAECEAQLPPLSPEEIRAIQDLMQQKDGEIAAPEPVPPRARIGPIPD